MYRKLPTKWKIVVLLVLVVISLWSYFSNNKQLEELQNTNQVTEEITTEQSDSQQATTEPSTTEPTVDGELHVYFLDVEQADCTILVSNGEALLIDAGNNDDEELVVEFLQELDVERLVYAVGTHSHEDHIGGLDEVILNCDPEYVIMPEEKNRTTKTYLDVLDAIEQENVPVIRPEVGAEYTFGDASFQILGPGDGEKKDPNEFSVCLRVTFGETVFLFTGDAEAKQEKEMLATGLDLTCDVFQAGHHGSSTSNIKEFVQAADPIYSVISVGEDNEYGHPHWETLTLFEEEDMQVYRTDQVGTILAVSDGQEIHWEFSE